MKFISAPTSKRVINNLFEAALPNLSNERLEWLADSEDAFLSELENLSDSIKNIGLIVMSDTEAGNFKNSVNVGILLTSLAHQIETLTAFISIADQAEFELNKRNTDGKPTGNKKPAN